MPRKTAGKIVPKSAKQIAAATKTILAYEWKDDSMNIMRGFVMGFAVCFIAALIVMSV